MTRQSKPIHIFVPSDYFINDPDVTYDEILFVDAIKQMDWGTTIPSLQQLLDHFHRPPEDIMNNLRSLEEKGYIERKEYFGVECLVIKHRKGELV